MRKKLTIPICSEGNYNRKSLKSIGTFVPSRKFFTVGMFEDELRAESVGCCVP